MVQCDSEVKRLQAINNQKKEFERKQQAIRDALKAVDTKPNKKIVFDLDDEPEIKKQKKTEKSKTVLFDSDDEDVQLTGHEFDLKPQISGELIKLQSRYGTDDRFVLDERFAENDEKMEIDSVEIDTNKSNDRKYKPMVRYDPEDESHAKYEKKREKTDSKKEKPKKEKKVKEVVEEEQEPPPVSNEIFYSVSKDLTQSLKKDEGFSLLKMFGKNEEEEDKIDNSKSESIQIESSRKYQFDTKNPFKYDSSDDERDEKEDDYFAKKDDKTPVIVNDCCFFFIKDDPRLTELTKEEFLQPQQKEEVNFNERRRELKRIVRKKMKNIQRDNSKWKPNKNWKDFDKRRKQK